MSWKGSGVIREQNVESALQLAALIDGGRARGYAVQEEAYLAALEASVSGINHKAAIRAVGRDCRSWFRLVAVSDTGDQYRVGRRLWNSQHDYQARYEHHRLRRRRRWIRDLYRCRWLRRYRWLGRDRCRSIGGNGSWYRSRRGKLRKCEVEVRLHDHHAGLVYVGLIRWHAIQ